MNVLFLTRSTLYKVYGGDTVQILSTAKYLRQLGIIVDIKLSAEQIDYTKYDLVHVFNVTRPADALTHIKKSGLPYVLSTIFVDFSEYQKINGGLEHLASKYFSIDQIEYAKAIARWIKNGESINSRQYLYYGHRKAVQLLAKNAAYLLPNSENEYKRFVASYGIERPYKVVYNGIDPEIFSVADNMPGAHDPQRVVCVARIEGKKNQLNLIKALNNTEFQLTLIGKPAPNHIAYYNACREAAAANISFEDFMPQEQLVAHYLSAKVHVLPSWSETCGLSSMEAAYLKCNIVITDKGDTTQYFGDNAWYCDPGDPQSIYEAIVKAAAAPVEDVLHQQITEKYNWQNAALQTLLVYKKVLDKKTHNKYIEVQAFS